MFGVRVLQHTVGILMGTNCAPLLAELFLNLHEGPLQTKWYDKRDDFNFPIVNILFICSKIPAEAAYEVYIAQLIRHSKACGSYQDFLDREYAAYKEVTEPRVPVV
jgi:hypothetical protein